MRAQVEQLVQVGTEAQQREQQLRAQVEQLTQQVQNPGPGSLQAVVGQAFQAMPKPKGPHQRVKRQKEERNVTLFDTKGLAKPEKFDGKEESFLYWRTKLESFIASVYPEFESVMAWAENEGQRDHECRSACKLWPRQPDRQDHRDVEGMNTQFYAVLQSLCEKESFTIVRSAGRNNGCEAGES